MMIIGCDDQYGCEFLKDRGFKKTFFLPHAVDSELFHASSQDKIYNILFPGTLIDPENVWSYWENEYSQSLLAIIKGAIDFVLQKENCSIESALKTNLVNFGDFKNLKITRFIQLCKEIEFYIKGKERIDLLSNLKEFEVHLFGLPLNHADYKKILGKNCPHLVFHKAVNFQNSLEIIRKSKIIIIVI